MSFEFSDRLLQKLQIAHRDRTYLHLPGAFASGLDPFHPSRLLSSLMKLKDASGLIQLAHRGEPIASKLLIRDGRLDGGRLRECMDQGAALLMIGLEKWMDNLGKHTLALAHTLEVDVSVNAYVGGPKSRGFAEHVDHHDVVVVQLEGEKDWTLWEPTLEEPLELPRHQEGAPEHELATLRLAKGDMLFVPRGVWHVARGTADLATAHLSFGLQPLTALHWLSAMRSELMDELEWRREIPQTPQARELWLGELKNSLTKRLTDDALSEYLRWRRKRYTDDV